MTAYLLFAGILEYPAQPLSGSITDLSLKCPEERIPIAAFQDAIAGKSLGSLQELYINAFDLRPDCTLNLGYHLFGDDGRRGLFLAELKDRMQASGIELGCELPDHISLLLRYAQRVEPERPALIEDCLLPALSRIAGILDCTDNPYKYVLQALLDLLRRYNETSRESVAAMRN